MEKRAMTIAFYIASPTWGGGEQNIFDLASAITRQGKVKTIFFFPQGSRQTMVDRFAQIGKCPTFPYARKLFRFSPFAAWQLARLLQKYEVDILHINSRFSYFQAAMAKRICRRSIQLVAGQHLVRRATDNLLWRWAYRQIDTLICVSRLVRETYIPTDLETVFPHITVIHNSVNLSQDERNTLDYSTARLIYHGRICAEKGVCELVKALEQVQDLPWQLDIAGTVAPEYRTRWEKALENSPIRDRIHLLGFRNDIRSLLSSYSIGVLPSIVPEACSLTLLENMAYGLATVSSDNGSEPEFINNGDNGLLVRAGDMEALATALRSLISDPSLRQRLGKQARQDFQDKHNYDLFIAQMNTIYGL